jgi:sugar phosphate isomerase/epimerase
MTRPLTMKLSCLSLSYRDSFSSRKMTLESFIETCYGLRLDCVDLHTSHFASDDRDYLLTIKRSCLRRGIDIACLAISNDFGKSGSALQMDVDNVKRWTRAAAYLGAPLVRVFAGWAPENDETAAWKRTVERLRECAAFGEESGVSVALQNHNHKALTRTGQDILRMVSEVNHRNLTHVLDTGQYVGSRGASGADPAARPDDALYASIEQTASLAVHVRAKLYRISSGVEEWLDYPRIFKILDGVHYNGAVSLVYEGWANEHEETAIPKGVAFLRRFVR